MVAEEGNAATGGAKTRKREHYSITNYIDLIDGRGMQDFADRSLEDIDAQIRKYR